ncbi:hypothetical protein WDU99_11675 [Microbacterium sp. Mu-80]|uniref:GH18 domain-containing protein n=1 Tax=Microbacterium bandirmense TaxID=3122050 RepID=A0ABU8LF66_9MICO
MKHRYPALAAAGLIAGTLLVAAPATASESDPTPTTTLNGYRNVGYYGQWRANGEAGATIKRLFIDTPAGQNLTHLNYAFGNIAGSQSAIDDAISAGTQGLADVDPYTCFISDGIAPASGETETAGDADSSCTATPPRNRCWGSPTPPTRPWPGTSTSSGSSSASIPT